MKEKGSGRRAGGRAFRKVPGKKTERRRQRGGGRRVSGLWILGHTALIAGLICAMILTRHLLTCGTKCLNQALLGALSVSVTGEGEGISPEEAETERPDEAGELEKPERSQKMDRPSGLKGRE